jgi:hypothetical protein
MIELERLHVTATDNAGSEKKRGVQQKLVDERDLAREDDVNENRSQSGPRL